MPTEWAQLEVRWQNLGDPHPLSVALVSLPAFLGNGEGAAVGPKMLARFPWATWLTVADAAARSLFAADPEPLELMYAPGGADGTNLRRRVNRQATAPAKHPGRAGHDDEHYLGVAERYREEGVPLVVLAGREYGSGSSRDWAAKGPALLGVRAVLAESYERIHRSNLIGMGVAPLQLLSGDTVASLGLTGRERFSITGIEGATGEELIGRRVAVEADGTRFEAILRIDTPTEAEYFLHGGILRYVVRKLAAS